MQYFSDTYFESKEKFRHLVTESGGQSHRREHPSAKGPAGEILSVDYAVFGNPQGHRVFFDLNGVHGNESYSGAAAQLRLIDSGRLNHLPNDMTVVLVHTINPYGWAFDSQLNEDGINLNRHFVDFDKLPASDELHLDIERALKFEEMSLTAAYHAFKRLGEIREAYGENRFWSAFMTGQYVAPKSFNYGGLQPAWSNDVLRDIAATHLDHAQKVAFIDWHTGVGNYGEPLALHRWEEGSEAFSRLSQWWGEEAVQRGSKGIFSGDDNEADSSMIQGLAQKTLFDAAPRAEYCGGIIEFGTVPFEELLIVAIVDLWLQFDAKEEGIDHRLWKSFQHFGFAPCDHSWRNSVLKQAERLHCQTIDGLIKW